MSWPLGLSAFFAGIYGQIDSVMLGYIKQLAQAGWYNASYRLVGVLMVPLSLVSTSFYPSLNNAFRESEETFKKIWSYYKKLMFGFAFFLVLGGIILAPWIINFFYGSKYQPAVLAFQILIFMLGFSFLQQPFLQALLVFKQEKKIFWVNFGGGLANLIFNLILIPKFSLYGAAVSMVISSIFMFLISFLFVYLYGKNKSKKNN